ncbi:hypothetical protein LVJ94_53005 [Pendulispora rubella]|uniref:Uncharacterized protein n=1 Tax=Pendulispora rubella TaxID=2741070 RepID=A0ABZ2L3R9_9BACT
MTKRSRTERRARERTTAKLVRDKWKIATFEPGGAPERPVVVVSASVVEAHARALPCALCGASVRVDEHTAEEHDGHRLRVARVTCMQCGASRPLYYQIAQPN